MHRCSHRPRTTHSFSQGFAYVSVTINISALTPKYDTRYRGWPRPPALGILSQADASPINASGRDKRKWHPHCSSATIMAETPEDGTFASTNTDEAELARMGYKQELK